MSNRLAGEISPYLLQHADNPVDWRPWGDEALAEAKRLDKPIFLSIGYSACHWCHVMERESFSDPKIAAELNRRFVCIKVDREERPDLDQLYMRAVQLMTGQGGWPLSVFLTPDLEPFFGGTYWPPTARMGMPGFDQVIDAVDRLWRTRREQAAAQAAELAEQLRRLAAGGGQGGSRQPPPPEALDEAAAQLSRQFDPVHGGFGPAPKFPRPMDLALLLRLGRRRGRPKLIEMVVRTLDKMAAGGLYDHLGGGFARYSTDDQWRVPHFEKMLSDNALLARLYVDAYAAGTSPDHARVARETLDYLLRDLALPEGGFCSSEDADSEGQEGKFYLWTTEEITRLLGPETAERFCYVYGVTDAPGQAGSVLHQAKTIAQCAAARGWDEAALREELAAARRILLDARRQRVRPARDDKVLVSWNGMAVDALARAAAVLEEARYRDAARRTARFLLDRVRRGERLHHCWRQGRTRGPALLDDYAFLVGGLITLYEADFDERWIDEAVRLADQMIRWHADRRGGGFYYDPEDQPAPIARIQDVRDGAGPSSTAAAAETLWRLGKLCGRADYLTAAREAVSAAADAVRQSPDGCSALLAVADMIHGPFYELVLLGDWDDPDTRAVVRDARRRYLPNRVMAYRERPEAPDGSPEVDPIFTGKHVAALAGPAAFLCRDFVCQAPAVGRDAVLELLDSLEATRSL